MRAAPEREPGPITRLEKADFDWIHSHLEQFWEAKAETVRPVHHSMFLYELGDTAYVIRGGGPGEAPAAYLFGFFAQTAPAAYVHLIGVRQDCRRLGLARRLYAHFIGVARARGARELRAITSPSNSVSIAFHRELGMSLLGEPGPEGVPVVRDYRGPGQDRVVFRMGI